MAVEYFVRWRNHLEVARVADYDRGLRRLTLTAFSVGRFEVVENEAYAAFLIGDDYSLFMDSAGTIECAQFTRYVPGESPRLEFCRESEGRADVIATLTKTGRLGVRNVFEGIAPPNGTDQMIFFDNIGIGPNGLFAVAANEIGLLADESDRYIVTDLDELIEV